MLVEQLFNDYRQVTNDDQAAATLVLADMMQRAKPDHPDQSLTIKEVAAVLRISAKRVYELCAAGELRTFKIGRSLRIPSEALKEYRQMHRQTPPVVPFRGRRNRCL
jgi:excisionase family DNA binding protein